MIDFRYHLVSIIAVFLALAVGLVLGATALSGPALVGLQKAEKTINRENATLLREQLVLKNQVAADQAFGGAAAPRLLAGLLTDRKVVLVAAPNSDGSVVSGVTAALRQAGATVTGEITLNPLFLDTGGHNEDELTQLAQSLATKAGVTLPADASGHVSGQQAAAKVLAASLLAPSGTAAASADSSTILNELNQASYLSIANGGTISGPASLAILIAPGGAPPQAGSQVLVALAVALRNAGDGAVMVGGSESVGPNSVLNAETIAGQVSTVDNADTEIGQIMTAQALFVAAGDKAPGQYGIGPGAAPSPAPTPSVTPTVTPSTHASSGGHK